jgi:hypothetical protein
VSDVIRIQFTRFSAFYSPLIAGGQGCRGGGVVFPEIERSVLTATIGSYQKLGCWTPHVEITRPAFEAALDVFQHSGSSPDGTATRTWWRRHPPTDFQTR